MPRPAQRKTIRRETLIVTAIAVLVVVLLVGLAWPFVRTNLQSVAVLDVVAHKSIPALLRPLADDPVSTRDLVLPLAGGPVRARLYVPRNRTDAPALLLLHGVNDLGIDDPRLVGFASAMAGCGLRVLTPELVQIADYYVGPKSITTIGESAVWLAQHDAGRAGGGKNGRPVGVMGLSFSGSLALLAAADPRYGPSMKFVVTVGSEDEMDRVADYFRTGEERRPDGALETVPPNAYGTMVMEYDNLQDFVPTAEMGPLRAVLRAHLDQDGPAEAAALAKLTAAQRAEAKQLMDTTSEATRRLLAESNARHLAAMAEVSPHGRLGDLTTPVYLLAGKADDVIPSAETQWLEAELPHGTLKAALISPVLSHMNLNGARPTFLDRMRLVHFFALVLHAAETK